MSEIRMGWDAKHPNPSGFLRFLPLLTHFLGRKGGRRREAADAAEQRLGGWAQGFRH